MYESKFSLAEKQELVTKFNNSRTNANKFCKNYNITPSTIFHWRKDLCRNQGFIPLHIVATSASSTGRGKSSITSSFTVSKPNLSL